jgi:hypothetical protein
MANETTSVDEDDVSAQLEEGAQSIQDQIDTEAEAGIDTTRAATDQAKLLPSTATTGEIPPPPSLHRVDRETLISGAIAKYQQSPRYQAEAFKNKFDQVLDARIEADKRGISWNPWEAFKTAVTAPKETVASWQREPLNWMADLADPAYKYHDQSIGDLIKARDTAQAKLDELNKSRTEWGSDFETASVQESMLRADLGSINLALDKKTAQAGIETLPGGVTPPVRKPTLQQNVLKAGEYIGHVLREVTGRERDEGGLVTGTIKAYMLNKLPTELEAQLPDFLKPSEQHPDVPRFMAPSPVYEETWPGKIIGGVAGTAPYIALSAATGPVAPLAELLAFAAQGSERMRQEALAAGLNEHDAQNAAMMGVFEAPLNVLTFRLMNLVPILKGKAAGKTAGQVTLDIAKAAGVMGAGSEVQNILDNVVVQASGIDPSRKWNEGMGQHFFLNALVGGILASGGELIGHRNAPSRALKSEGKSDLSIASPNGSNIDSNKPPADTVPVRRPGEPPSLPGTGGERIVSRTEGLTKAEQEARLNELAQDLGVTEEAEAKPPPLPGEEAAARITPGEEPKSVTAEPTDLQTAAQRMVDRHGARLRTTIADHTQLSAAQQRALRDSGIDPARYTSFWDRGLRTWFVNPNTVSDVGALHEQFLRNLLPSAFGDKARIVPIDTFAQVAHIASVARHLTKEPNADFTTNGLYDPESGTIFLNVPKHLNSANPIGQGLRTVMHEVVGHQGNRQQFGNNYVGYNELLDRIYAGFRANGSGDAIAGQFGTTMDGLAERYGWGNRDANGNLVLSKEEQRRLAEELLGRYAEAFNPHELERLPNVLQKTVRLVRDGWERFQGIKTNRFDAFRLVQKAWRAASPPRTEQAHSALIARRMILSHETPEYRSARTVDQSTTELHETARAVAPVRTGLQGSRGQPISRQEITASSARLGAHTSTSGEQLTERGLQQRSVQIAGAPGDAVDIRFPRNTEPDHSFVLVLTRPDSESGPYGPAPSFGTQPGRGSPYARNQATAEQYLERLALANEYFGNGTESGNQFEGTLHDESTGLERIVSSSPRLDGNFRSAEVGEIAGYMSSRGFHPIDEHTYYNPQDRVLVLEADPGHVLIEGDSGNFHALDVAPFKVDGGLAAHLDRVVRLNDPALGLPEADLVKTQLAAHGAWSQTLSPEAQKLVEARVEQDRIDLQELRAKSDAGTLTSEEKERLDQIEMGPLLNKDIEDELGPRSPDKIPINILNRAIENARRLHPGERVENIHTGRTVADVTESDAVRMFNFAEDQLMHEKSSQRYFNAVTDGVLKDYGNDYDQLITDMVDGKFGSATNRPYEDALYKRLKADSKVMRAEAVAAGDLAKADLIDAYRFTLDDWMNKRKTNWGWEGQNFQEAVTTGEAIKDSAEAQFNREVINKVKKDPEFKGAVRDVQNVVKTSREDAAKTEAVDKVLGLAQKAEDAAAGKAKKPKERKPSEKLTPEEIEERKAERKAAEEERIRLSRSLPDRTAEAIANQLSNRIKEASDLDPRIKGAFQEMADRLQRTIAGQAKEAGAIPTREAAEKMSAAGTLREALDNWDYFKFVRDRFIQEALEKTEGKADLQHALGLLDTLVDVPFTKPQLAAALREGGMNIRELYKEHNARIGRSIVSLSDFLVRNSHLSKAQADMVEKAVSDFINAEVAVRRKKEFERIIEHYAKVKVTDEIRGSTMQRLLNLIHIGSFSDEKVANALAKLYGFKGYDPKMDAELSRIADELDSMVQAGRQGLQTQALRDQLNRTLANYAPIRFWNYWSSIFKGNILTTFPGHVIAFMNEFQSGLGRLMYRMAQTRDPATFAAGLQQMGRGFLSALEGSKYILRTGNRPADFMTQEELLSAKSRWSYARAAGGDFFETHPTERIFARAGLGALGKLIDYPYIWSHRGITALHYLIYSGFGRPTELLAAAEYARRNKGMDQAQALAWARESVNGNKGTLEFARQTATREGLKGSEHSLRVQEILDQAMPDEVLETSDYAGTRANAFQDGHGLFGAISDAMSKITREHPELAQFMPIIRVPMNLINTALDISPIGFARIYLPGAKYGERYLTRGGKLEFSQHELELLKGELLAKAIGGTTLMAAGMILASQRRPDGSFLVNIYGAGPQNQDEKYQWMDRGGEPYTIKVGDRSWAYETFPGWLALAAIGNWQDAQRFKDMPPGPEAFTYSVGRNMAAFLDRSFMRGLSDLSDMLKQVSERPEQQGSLVERYAATQLKSFIPIYGMGAWKQVYQQFLNDKLYRAAGWGAIARDLPFAADAVGLKPMINYFGEPIEVHPLTHRFWSKESSDPIWQFLDRHNLWIAKPSPAFKIDGQPLTDNQKYEFTIMRGHYLKDALQSQMSHLDSLDEEARIKAFKHIERAAGKRARNELILRGIK